MPLHIGFCNLGKGLVERLMGYTYWNVFVTLPRNQPWEGSTKRWLKRCDRYKNRPICGQRQTIAELLEAEQRELLSLLKQRFEAARVKILRADYFSTIGVDGNRYFVPVEYTGRNVTVKQLSAWKFFPGRKDRLLRTLLRQRADHMLP